MNSTALHVEMGGYGSVCAQDLVDFGITLGLPRVAIIDDIRETAPILDRDNIPLARKLGWPDWVIDSWVEKKFTLHSPINHAARSHPLPFIWRCRKLRAKSGRKNNLEGQVVDFLESIHISCGVAVPVHLPKSKLGIVIWARSVDDIDLQYLLAHAEKDVLFLSYKMMQGIEINSTDTSSEHEGIELTRRERECLNWAARGKTDKEIASILFLSPLTVRCYIDSAVKKLDASTRIHGVAKACKMGIINPF